MVTTNHIGMRSGGVPAMGLTPKLRECAGLTVLVLLIFSILTLWVPDGWALWVFQGCIFALTSLIVVRYLLRPFELRGSIVLLPLGGIVCLGVLQIFTRQTVYAWETWISILAWAANFALVFLALQLFRVHQARQQLLRSIFYFGFVLSVAATTQLFTSPGKVFWLFPSGYSDYVMGPFVSRNLYAAFIELLLPIGLVYALTARGGRLIHAAMCSVMFASVVAGASRAGLLLISAEVLAVLLLARIRSVVTTRQAAVALGRFVLLAVGFVCLFGGAALWQRLQQPDPYAGRREMRYSSWDMVRERPWMGFGLGTWHTVYPRFAYYDDGTVTGHAHNDWAEWSADGGLPLLTLMMAVAILSLRPAVRSLWGIGTTALWLHSIVDSPLQNTALAGWFFLIVGAVAVGAQEDEDSGSKQHLR
jgi:O-antigen ligase